MAEEVVYFKLKMKRNERIKIKSEAASRDMTMQDFMLDCILKCCNKKE